MGNPYHYDFTVQIQEIALFINVLFLGVPVSRTEATLIKSSHSLRRSVLIPQPWVDVPPFFPA